MRQILRYQGSANAVSPIGFLLLIVACDASGPVTPVYPMLTITTTVLASGVVGTAYSGVFEATGGDGIYTRTVASDALPDGLTLTIEGMITGIPTAGGMSEFAVRVRSQDAQMAWASYSVSIETPLLGAFIADQGWEPQGSADGPRAVLQLIRNEGADLVLHQGDFDYRNDPSIWIDQIDDVLGPDFPYLASIGNHDLNMWDGSGGYRALLEARAIRQGITWRGTYGEASSVLFSGIRILMGAPGVKSNRPQLYADYFESELATSDEIWRVCSWHKNQPEMQLGPRLDEIGWEVYETCREGGAIIATGHNHVYSRTHLLSNMATQTIASEADTLTVSSGETFVLISGLGGLSLHPQTRTGPWWAAVYTPTQDATYGALFGRFNANGIPGLAHFYFKNIRQEIIDEFWVSSAVRR